MEGNDLKNTQDNLISQVEALLFIAPGPVASSQLAETMEISDAEVEELLIILQERYEKGRGLNLMWFDEKVLLTTQPQMGDLIEKFLGLESTTRLSRAALETMAIIAYKQPITRPAIDEIRGVNSDGVIKSLLSKGLISELDRATSPGRPILYGITPDFLQHFGLKSLSELPTIELYENRDNNNNHREILKD